MIAVVDYGLGNVQAIINVYQSLDIPARRANSPMDLEGAERLILPGVGAFDQAMDKLNRSGMRQVLDEMVLGQGVPLLGICVGMQMMARCSEEGAMEGLGWIDGEVRRLSVAGLARKPYLPHMGWNTVDVRQDTPLFTGLEANTRFYFLHSFAFEPTHENATLTATHYGNPFVSSVHMQNRYGVQFHPEKSHKWGIDLLRHFASI